MMKKDTIVKPCCSGFSVTLDRIVMLYMLYFLVCIIHSEGVSITTGLETTGLICAFLFARSIPRKRLILLCLTVTGALQAVYVIFQQCGVVESSHEMFKITGFMGNPGPLGGFQAISLICGLSLYRQCEGRIGKIPIIVSSALVLYSLILSDSRASFIAAISGIIAMTYKPWRAFMKRHKWAYIVLLCLISVSLWIMYIYRPESANARILIWRVCASMFVDKPLFGFGAYGFNHHYMLYQEEYLCSHPNSMFTHLATDVAYPYNEFIHILIEHGLVGLFIFILMIYKGLKECHSPMLCAPLVTLLTFSLFSYPSYKLALCVMLPLFLGILPTRPLTCSTKANTAIVFLSIITAISCFLGIAFYEHKLHRRISEAYNNTPEVISDINTSFIQNHNNLKINALYATLAKHFPEIISSDTIPLIFPSSENWCTIGNHFLMKNDYADAERYLRQASGMAPSLIHPKYLLWGVYLKQGKENDASRIANEILNMRAKVENTYTLRIRNEIINYKQNQFE